MVRKRLLILLYMSRNMRFPTMWYMRPAKTQISLRIRTVWSEPLLYSRLNILWLLSCWPNGIWSFKATGSPESTLVKMPHCWKSHVAAHMVLWLFSPFYNIRYRTAISTTQLWPFPVIFKRHPEDYHTNFCCSIANWLPLRTENS